MRVLSSIRVPMIVPIVMLAIKDSASDMSPYVRKTAAHAIPKLYRYNLTLLLNTDSCMLNVWSLWKTLEIPWFFADLILNKKKTLCS